MRVVCIYDLWSRVLRFCFLLNVVLLRRNKYKCYDDKRHLSNRLLNLFDNRFDNWLYRVNGVSGRHWRIHPSLMSELYTWTF